MAYSSTEPTTATAGDMTAKFALIVENFRAIVQGDAGVFTNGLPPERGRSYRPGEFQLVAYSAGHFTAQSGITWTTNAGSIVMYRYSLVGKQMTMVFEFVGSGGASIVGTSTSNTLNVDLPAGFTAAGSYRSNGLWNNGGGSYWNNNDIYASVTNGDTRVTVQRLLAAVVGGIYAFSFTLVLEVQ